MLTTTQDVDQELARRVGAGFSAIVAPLVLYHHPCPDGRIAAVLARRRWADAALVPVNYGAIPGDLVDRAKWRHVLVLDFALPRALHEAVRVVARSLLVLDHHATSRWLAEDRDALWDDQRSGAGLALDAFFPEYRARLAHEERDPKSARGSWSSAGSEARALARIALYAEDRDLWRFRLPSSREVNAALGLLPRDPRDEAWDDPPAIDELAEQGETVLAVEEALVARVVEKAVRVRWAGLPHDGEVLVACSSVLQSEIGEALAASSSKDHPDPVAGVAWYAEGDAARFSVRSRADSAHDGEALRIASARGGGGHPNAAGFTVRLTEVAGLVAP